MNNCAVSMNAPGVIWFLCRAQWRFSQIAIPAIGYAEWPAAFAFSFSNIDNKKTHVGTFETSRDVRSSVAIRGKADVARTSHFGSDWTQSCIATEAESNPHPEPFGATVAA
jgi:hypothetical protein